MKAIAGLLIVSVVLAVGACSDGGQEESDSGLSADEVAERYNYDVETAQYTPVFELVPAFDNGYEGRARNAFMADCLRGVIEYNVPPPGDREALFSRDHQLMFNEEIAAEWGYPGSRLPRQEAPGVDPEKVTPEIEAEIERCGNEIPAEFRARPTVAG